MIIHSANLSIERSADLPESTFKIKASAKAFKILSDGLYSNKPLAVIREYFCNAVDAHVAAGKQDTAIEVHLPNEFEPFFGVKDFGIGMSHEDVLNVYTTYFESTKNASNDQIGGLGIGGKAFFCYADSFSIISRFNGVKRTYTAFINEHGLPSIALLGEEATDESNGLEVQGAVSPSDFSTFAANARKFFARVSPAPIFKGNSGFTPNGISFSPDLAGNGWRVRTDDGENAHAIMGVVAYPIDVDYSRLSALQAAMTNLPLDIDFGIGEIEVAASREKLSFTPQSIVNLAAKLDSIRQEIADKISKRFDDCSNRWSAKTLLRKLYNGELSKFRSLLGKDGVMWKGEKLLLSPEDLDGVAEISDFVVFSRNYRGKVSKMQPHKRAVDACDEAVIYINDLALGTISRVRYLFNTNHDIRNKKVVVITPRTMQDVPAIMAAMGREGDTLPLTSSLAKPPRNSVGVTEKGKAKVLKFDAEDQHNYAANAWELPDESFDVEDGGIYVELERYDICGKKPREYFQEFLRDLPILGIDLSTLEVYGFKKGVVSKAQANPKWVHLTDYLKKEVEARIAKKAVAVQLADHDQVETVETTYKWLEKFIKALDKMGVNSVFADIASKIKTLKTNAATLKRAETWRAMANAYGVQIQQAQATHNIIADLDDVVKIAPMMKVVVKAIDETGHWQIEPFLKEFLPTIVDHLREKGLTNP